jgi:hypothetical protein
MPAFLLGVVALLLLLWGASAFIKADPKEAARVLRWIAAEISKAESNRAIQRRPPSSGHT